ncbi:MAG: hypothetical protein OEW52_00135 [Thermoleophilia bacterium]|nr:hypothetical protein [Thermoleophilia bacterium]
MARTVLLDARPPQGGGGGGGDLPADLIFTSSFTNGQGNGDAYALDGGRWQAGYGSDTYADVIASTGLDFPSPNCLRWGAANVGGAQNQTHVDWAFPVPAIGESVSLRRYWRIFDRQYLGTGGEHPSYFGTHSPPFTYPSVWTIDIQHGGGSTFTLFLASTGNHNGGGGTTDRTSTVSLNLDQTYRFEMRITRTGTLTFTALARIYDTAGNLVYDETDFVCGSLTLATAEWTVPSSGEFNDLVSWINGWEGVEGRSGPFEPYSYESCYAVCAGVDATFPIGPFNEAEADWTP